MQLLLNTPWLMAPRAYQVFSHHYSLVRERQHHEPMVSAKPIAAIGNYNETPLRVENGIAILPIHGVLFHRAGEFDLTDGIASYETIENNLYAALNNRDVKGILLDIDSPGGEVSGLFDLADSIYEVRSLKPLWAIANDTAYSAAYAIASAASKVYATSTGSVGSIGVIATHLDQSAYNERKGFKVTSITAGAHKNDYSPHQPLTEAAASILQCEVDRLYGMFVDVVARNRTLSPDHIRSTEAGLFYGGDAVTQKLVNGVQSFNQTLEAFQKHISSKQLTSHSFTDKDQFMPNLKKPSAHSGNSETAAEIQTHSDTELNISAEASLSTVTPATASHNQPLSPSNARTDRQALLTDAEERGRESMRAQALEIIELCALARLPDQIGPFLKQNLSVDAAREALLNRLAQNTQEPIYAHTHPHTESPQSAHWVVREAQARAGITDITQGK